MDNPSVQRILDNPPGGKSKRRNGACAGVSVLCSLAPAGPRAKRIKLTESEEESDAEDMEVESGQGDAAKVTNPVVAEEIAAQARATKSVEERQQDFKTMLLERGASLIGPVDSI